MKKDTRDLRAIADELKSRGMRCNCDLDNFVPESSTDHSFVCRIHKLAIKMKFNPHDIIDLEACINSR